MTRAIFSATCLTKTYTLGETHVLALRGVSLEIQASEVERELRLRRVPPMKMRAARRALSGEH